MGLALHQLGYFVAVADHGSFTGAAADLYVAQPSLSAQVHKLEHELGTQLFDRHARCVSLTQAGVALLPIARRTLADAEQLRQTADQILGLRGGTLRVGATPSLACCLLPPALSRFHNRHPGVVLSVAEAGSDDLVTRLEANQLDLAAVSLPVRHGPLETLPLAEEELVVVVSTDHDLARRRRIRVEDLDGVPLVIPRQGYTLRTTVLAACRQAGFEPVVACEGGEMQGVLALVARGLGAAVVPTIAASHVPGLHVVRLAGPRLLRRIGLARRADVAVPASAEAFTSEVLTLFIKGGWPGVRPAGLRPVTGDGANGWGGQA